MTELTWLQAFPPRDAGLADLTAMLRLLASRPHYGLRRLQPLVVFELWLFCGRVVWLVGVEPTIARTLANELTAQLPELVLVPAEAPARPTPITGREIRLTSLIFPLRRDAALGVTAGLLRVRDGLRGSEAVVLQWVVGPSHTQTQIPISRTPLDVLGFTQARQPDSDERQAWKAKLAEPLFGVRGRLGAVAGDPRRGAELIRPAVSALSLAGGPHARIYASPQSSQVAAQLIRVMGALRSFSGILGAGELATLVGWCLGNLEVPGGPGAFAPPPPALLHPPTSRSVARPLGVSTHPATRSTMVWLPRTSFATHVHAIGPTGRGKSTLLAHWVLAEAQAGGSVVVIEPRGDLVADILARLPHHTHDRVVVIDPGAGGPVVGFNPLAGPRHDAERRADNLLGLLRELFGPAIGPRSADVLLHALIIAARLDNGALTDVLPILGNPQFRRLVASRGSDPLTIAPWLAWFNGLSDEHRAQVVMPITNKIRPFTARPAIRRLLGQPHPKFNLGTVFERPTVLLVNLNAGAIGPEAARLTGALLLSQLWAAIQRQTTRPAHERRPVSVVVDELPSFIAGLDFADVLARSRGANVSFTVAHQHLGQLGRDLEAAVLANIGTRVAFRPAEGDGRALARVLGGPVEPDDLQRLDAYHAVVRAMVDGVPSKAFEVATPNLPPASQDPRAVQRASAERYGVDPAELDAALLARWQGGDPPDVLVGLMRRPS